ncbi:hypothetical protein PPYR_10273 [Photinus pyralis]|uniref:Meteorin-like protein n=1 Tax=Photinus pyralis TaxID=7054 RepID=A0A1Y1LGF1_PHOPY|nr:meteorin-like protein [Photinus pyralis]KAB0796212.1 hypothetical protein PPYR_10273 [Photinus pyralis]
MCKMGPDVYERGRGRVALMDYCVIFACLMWVTSATIMGDECDWTGSGLTTSSEDRGVTPVYLRCTTGRVTWLYPRGALRVLLRLPGRDREFRACIKVHPDGVNQHLAARLFLEGPRSLLPLYSHENGGHKPVRCFQSRHGQVALYIEAIGGSSMIKRVAKIEYDLEPLPKGSQAYDPTEECRPCSAEELAHTFCTSDLVTRGIIHGIENDDDLEVSQISVKVTKLIRHTADEGYRDDWEESENSIDSGDVTKEITVQVPQHCGVKHGLGEFVFMARRKLGDLTLQCAPRLEDWAAFVNVISEEGKAHCVLRS